MNTQQHLDKKRQRCIWILNACVLFFAYFEASGPREVLATLGLAQVQHPTYLFADSHAAICRRIRRITHNGKIKIYVENYNNNKTLHIKLQGQHLRNLIGLCATTTGVR